MDLAIKLEGAQQAAEIALGDVRRAHGAVAGEAELEDLGSEEPPGSDCNLGGSAVGIGDCKAAVKLRAGEPRQFVEVLNILHLLYGVVQGVAERDEQLVEGVELDLHDVGSDTEVTQREIVYAGRLVVHVEDGDAGIVLFGLELRYLHSLAEDGILCGRAYGDGRQCKDDKKTFHCTM